MSTKKKKVKPRRRELARIERRAAAAETPSTPDSRLKRAARAATSLGIVAVVLSLVVQYKVLPNDVGPNGVLALKVAGGALVIAGFIFGRGTRVRPAGES